MNLSNDTQFFSYYYIKEKESSEMSEREVLMLRGTLEGMLFAIQSTELLKTNMS